MPRPPIIQHLKDWRITLIKLKRAYEPACSDDGCRVLVDRIWPRGASKADLRIDRWEKELGPSTQLRKWFGHDPTRWSDFRDRYLRELDDPEKQQLLDHIAEQACHDTVTLLYAARDTEHNQAVVLKEVIENRSRVES